MISTKKVVAFAMLLIVSTVLVAAAKDSVYVKSGFLTGNTFRSLGSVEKLGYAKGFIDGVLVAPLFGAPKVELLRTEQCVVGMTDEQVVAILNKFLADNPGRWQEQMNALSYSALKSACGE